MATTPGYGWPIPDLTGVADGPDGFSDLALAIETTARDKTFLSYTPSWTSAGSIQPINPAARWGYYRIENGICDFVLQISFGSSTGGGSSSLYIGLPIAANSTIPGQNIGTAYLFVPGLINYDRWVGFPNVSRSATNFATLFPVNRDSSNYGPWQNTDSSGAVGGGIPDISVSSQFNVRPGGFIQVQGRYFTA